MAPDAAKSQGTREPTPRSTLATTYLIAYNSVSAICWATVLGYALIVPYIRGFSMVYPVANSWTRGTQTLALMEIIHAATGIVRAPVMTTVMQVASRIAIMWFVVLLFPGVARSPAYTTMLLAWSVTEVIRYTYFALMLCGVKPRPLTLVRYNTFWAMYPLGILSECGLIWLAASGPANRLGPEYQWVLLGLLAIYIPGAPILFSHMIRQRNKIMRAEFGDRKRQ